MDTKLVNDSISTTILEGLKFIQCISKHLPEDLTEKTHSVTLSFRKLLRVLDQAKRMCVLELNRNYAARRNTCTSLSDEQVDLDYETLSSTAVNAKNIISNFSRVDERKPMKIPPDTTSYNYLEILEKNDSYKVPTNPHANEKNSLERTTNNTVKEEKVNNNNVDERKPVNIPPDTTQKYLVIQEDNNSNSHTHRIRLNITVNNELKGMYYCLIENGQLLLDRNINADHSEYVISLSEKTFKLVNNFTIKFTNKELELALLFSSKIDCETWVNYLTADRECVYTYVTIDKRNVPKTLPPKVKLNPIEFEPIKKSRSVDTILQPESDFIEWSSLSLEIATQAYERKLSPNLPINKVTAPLPIPPTNYPCGSKEKVTPKGGIKRCRRFLPLKKFKDAPNTGKANVMPQNPSPYENIRHV